MLSRLGDYGYIATTIAFTVYGQLILKWRVSQLAPMPENFTEKVIFLVRLVFDPFIFSGYVAAFLAALAWTAALTRFELNFAYPYMGFSYVFVLLLSAVLLSEPLTASRAIGVALIVGGIAVASRG